VRQVLRNDIQNIISKQVREKETKRGETSVGTNGPEDKAGTRELSITKQ
jgi:hypothetical protein